MKKFDVLTLGSAMIDHTFYTPDVVLIAHPEDPLRQRLMGFEYGAKLVSEEITTSLGGGGCNTAACFRLLGLAVACRVSVGLDEAAEQILNRLKKQGVDSRWVQQCNGEHSGLSFLVVEPKAYEHVAFVTQGANRRLDCSEAMFKQFKLSGGVYVAPLRTPRWKAMLSVLMKAKKKQSFRLAWNPGTDQLSGGLAALKPLLAQVDVLILNEDEATELTLAHRSGVKATDRATGDHRLRLKKLCETLARTGVGMVVVTAGSRGAGVSSDGQFIFQPAVKVKTKDTTGAGDCFGSTFVGLHWKGWELERALRGASQNAASLVQQIGAQQGLLSLKELNKKLNRERR